MDRDRRQRKCVRTGDGWRWDIVMACIVMAYIWRRMEVLLTASHPSSHRLCSYGTTRRGLLAPVVLKGAAGAGALGQHTLEP